ncbi:hypothetical protein [Sulfitobacter guttiformis]|uniref:Uncharacterized protein n=1 Tax=Sulfitobacter guttiformis TaxID=74349 RepID=A0A420DNU8_9RHOB|nr:hypothetical protein [Sulfitobacter guttiformis]KIN73274.1 hypothetical protein Z949_2463 [Sulfitobacter guttiformis KCTC 32187]RKE95946.1 hypothetical protein C8N30_0493 [Sulfitobacter guttiformis]
MITEAQLEEQLYHLKRVTRGHGDQWSVNFARSILRQAKNPKWKPTARQQPIIEKLINESRFGGSADSTPDNIELIETEKGSDAV